MSDSTFSPALFAQATQDLLSLFASELAEKREKLAWIESHSRLEIADCNTGALWTLTTTRIYGNESVYRSTFTRYTDKIRYPLGAQGLPYIQLVHAVKNGVKGL